MYVLKAIAARRSIRNFADREIPKDTIETILQHAHMAPSAKNRQPWKFVVVTEKEKPAMLDAMRRGFARDMQGEGLLGLLAANPSLLASAEHSLRVMEQAPVTIFVLNTDGNTLKEGASIQDRLLDVTNLQSIGAAIQNMLLAAGDLGIGSLWICDVFFAYDALLDWLSEKNQLIAAVALGYPEENPGARPRKPLAEVIEWR